MQSQRKGYLWPVEGRIRDPAPWDILSAVLDRPRVIHLSWAALCFSLFGVLTLLVVQDRVPDDAVDHLGEDAADWAAQQDWLWPVLRFVEVAFSFVPMAITTLVIAALLWRRHRRAAIYTVAVMSTTALVNVLLKQLVGRERPIWQSPDALYSSPAFPSGHASSTAALMGIVCVLTMMLVRRAGLRRLVYVGAALVLLLVCLDRVLLGRHYVTDVVAGSLLGAGMVLLWMALFNPLPRSHAAKELPLVEAVPSTRQLAVVLNPSKVEDVASFRSVVSSMAQESGWSTPTWHYTTVEDPGRSMAEAAAVSGADLVLVCGGDGTVREVCAELAGTGVPVGIVPAGTGNLLARNLEIPLFLRAAIDVALNGQDRAIDLVEVSGDGFDNTHFMVMAGMGLDAAIMEGVNEDIKRRVGWLAYVLSGIKALMSPVVRLEISIDDGEFAPYRARTVVVGNVGYLQAGMPLLPDAAIDDGVLDVVLLYPKRFFSWVPLAARVLSRRRRTDDTIDRLTGQSVAIRAAADTPRQLDGDSIGPGRELRMRCIHGRLLVRVPR